MSPQPAPLLLSEAPLLLQQLIAIPSFSREEEGTASLLTKYLFDRGARVSRGGNNVWALHPEFDPAKPSLLLIGHHDTVKPNAGYTRDPFKPSLEGDRLYGLGSNDAGGALVALLTAFLHFGGHPSPKYNLIFAAVAEEEISGAGGVESILPLLPPVAAAIVGEPTGMQLAVAERGLLVLDLLFRGQAGHAARAEGVNAIYRALPALDWFRNYRFKKVSPLLGEVRMSITVIETSNKAHNVVPDECRLVADIRVHEGYTLEEVLETVRKESGADECRPRSLRLRATSIASDHPLVKAGIRLGRTPYGSPTTSDKALLPFPALKMGPGDSARSHTADEYILRSELEEGIRLYIQLLNEIL